MVKDGSGPGPREPRGENDGSAGGSGADGGEEQGRSRSDGDSGADGGHERDRGAHPAFPRRRFRWLASLGLGVGVSLLFLYLTLRRVDLEAVRNAISSVSLPVLSLALLTRGSGFLAMGLRSRVTLAPAGPAPFRILVLAHLLGFTGSNVLPFRLGEILRVDYLARRTGHPRSFLLGTVAVERLMDAAVLLLLFALIVPTVLDRSLMEGSYPLFLAATAAAVLTGILVVRWGGLPEVVGRLLRPLGSRVAGAAEVHVERGVTGLLALSHARWAPAALGATGLYWLTGIGSFTVIMAAFGLDLPWYAPFLVAAVTSLGTALPSAPGFVGTYHYFAALGISFLGVDPSVAASFAIVAHAMAFLPFTLLGLGFFAHILRVQVGGAGRRGGVGE